jgi:hypothetical protein
VPAPLPDDLVEAGHGGIGVDGVVDEVGEGLACELVSGSRSFNRRVSSAFIPPNWLRHRW